MQSILFVESVEKQSKDEEIENTDADIQEFKQIASKSTEDDEDKKDRSLIDELVSIIAPSTVGNDLAKKAMLIVAVNAGLPNDPTRLPKRIRSHVGLIGDPGLAKTQLLHQIADLVPGSRVESMQSGTPVSMTVYIDKEENGQRTMRPGPVVLASSAILGVFHPLSHGRVLSYHYDIHHIFPFPVHAKEGNLNLTLFLDFPFCAYVPSFSCAFSFSFHTYAFFNSVGEFSVSVTFIVVTVTTLCYPNNSINLSK